MPQLELPADPVLQATRLPLVEPAGIDWDRATAVDLASLEDTAPEEAPNPFGGYFYRGSGSGTADDWLIGRGDRLGIYSLVLLDGMEGPLGWLQYDLSTVIHFVSGPRQTDLPPRLYDFTLAVPFRQPITDRWSCDLTVRAGWYSDFEGSVRDAVRFPSHAVFYHQTSQTWQWLLGIDYLDRDDVPVLPVAGAVWTPREDLRIEAIFPRPRVAFRCTNDDWTYLALEMGGGTWGIERSSGAADIVTYRDFRVSLGTHTGDADRVRLIEIGWSFGRHLEYRSGTPDYDPPDTLLLRSILLY